MANIANTEAAAARLAELSREIEDLEDGRAGLLMRIDQLRSSLVSAGQRTASMRASVDLFVEHITTLVASMEELRVLEEEMRELNRGLSGTEKESSAMVFEVDSFNETVAEAEEELERISAILFQGKIKLPRGH
jgi:chromosome segregation ATPase